MLEVKNTASIEVIRAAYKAGVKRYHPDNYTDEEDKNWATEQLFSLLIIILTVGV